MIIELENDGALVVQFRIELLDLKPFEIAREKLGSIVSDIGLLEDEEL